MADGCKEEAKKGEQERGKRKKGREKEEREGDGADAMPLGRLQDGCLRFDVLLGCHDGRVQASRTRLESSG